MPQKNEGFRGSDSACARSGAVRGIVPQILEEITKVVSWVQLLDKVILPVVMQDMFSGLDVQKTVDVPQLQFENQLTLGKPVVFPQV